MYLISLSNYFCEYYTDRAGNVYRICNKMKLVKQELLLPGAHSEDRARQPGTTALPSPDGATEENTGQNCHVFYMG